MTAMKISRRLAVDALHQGVDAADAGRNVRACPYDLNCDDVAEYFAGVWWVRGWRRRTMMLGPGAPS